MAVLVGEYGAVLTGGVTHSADDTYRTVNASEGQSRGCWSGSENATFPPTGIDVEPLYPFVPEGRSSVMVHRTDNMVWHPIQKASTKWRHEPITIAFLVRSVYMKTLIDFLIANKGNTAQPVILNLPGIQPFLRTSQINDVYIIGYSRPIREREFIYKISITFLRAPTV